MHDIVFYIAIVWQLLLAMVLTLYTWRTRHIVNRILGLEVLAMLIVAAVACVAIQRDESGYLDVALVLAMLGFIQTVAAARLAELRKEFR